MRDGNALGEVSETVRSDIKLTITRGQLRQLRLHVSNSSWRTPGGRLWASPASVSTSVAPVSSISAASRSAEVTWLQRQVSSAALEHCQQRH